MKWINSLENGPYTNINQNMKTLKYISKIANKYFTRTVFFSLFSCWMYEYAFEMLTYIFRLLLFFERTHTLNCRLSYYVIFNATIIESHFQMESNNTLLATFWTIFISSMQHFDSFRIFLCFFFARALFFSLPINKLLRTLWYWSLFLPMCFPFTLLTRSVCSVLIVSLPHSHPMRCDFSTPSDNNQCSCISFSSSVLSPPLHFLSFSVSRSLFTCMHKIGKNVAKKRIIFCVSVYGWVYGVCMSAFKTFVVQKFQKKICKWFHFDTVAFASIHIQLNGIFVHCYISYIA